MTVVVARRRERERQLSSSSVQSGEKNVAKIQQFQQRSMEELVRRGTDTARSGLHGGAGGDRSR